MPYANKDDANARSRRYYAANRNKLREYKRRKQRERRAESNDADKAYYRRNPKRMAWHRLRSNARRRGLECLLSFEEFCEFWGDDFGRRGNGNDQLQTARYGDVGPYAMGNIYKATGLENKQGPRIRG